MREKREEAANLSCGLISMCMLTSLSLGRKSKLVLIIMLAFVWHFAVYPVFTVLLNPLSLHIMCCGRWKEGGARKLASLGAE